MVRMRALGRDYYVSLLTAAAMHGAAHQAPQVFQVMVDRHVADRDIERVKLRFYTNEYLDRMTVQERQVDTAASAWRRARRPSWISSSTPTSPAG